MLTVAKFVFEWAVFCLPFAFIITVLLLYFADDIVKVFQKSDAARRDGLGGGRRA